MSFAISQFWPTRSHLIKMAVLGVVACLGSLVHSTPPGVEIDAKIAGKWQVLTEPGNLRIYEISKLRYVRIVGGPREDRSGRLVPLEDGTYLLKLDNKQLQRIIYLPDSDKLSIEHFVKKQDYDLKLPGNWKTEGIRKE